MSPRLGPDREHAIVIGGSLAGLFAARVLSDHFRRVTILERDPISDRPESRKGQPQTRHVHGLLAQGLRLIEDLFPGIQDALVEHGAIVADMGAAMRWYHFGGYRIPFTSGLEGMMMSRPLLEWQVRRRVLHLPNVAVRAPCAARALLATADRARVTGVRTAGGREADAPDSLAADLVVDACGRGSVAPAWLEGLGYDRPPKTKVTVRVGYSTRIYRRRPGDLDGAELVMILPTPPGGKSMAAILPVEGDRWIVTAGGWVGHYPPGDEPGFLDFIRSLPVPDAYDIVSRAEPLSDIVTYRFPSNQRCHYEKLRRFPEGYLVIGDAVASFNPIYGQGMTSTVMQAHALADVLGRRKRPGAVWRPFFQEVARVVTIPWQTAAGEDFRYPETEGAKPPFTDLVNAYVARVHVATHADPVVYGQFLRVMNMIDPPASLMRPRMMWRVVRRRR